MKNKRNMGWKKEGNKSAYSRLDFENIFKIPKSKRSTRASNQLSSIKCLPDSKRSQVTVFIILAIMIAVGKPKMALPKRGQRTATNMMKKSSRGK